MNKLVLIVFFALFSLTVVQAQEFKFGLKGGINKTFGGQITGNSSGGVYDDGTYNAEGEIGFHGGLWTQLSFGKFFLRPEVVYSKLESRFDFPGRSSIYNVDVLSVPFLVGYNVWGPIDIYAGPSYNKIMDARLQGTEPESDPPLIVVQNFPLSAQAGIKAEFGAFGIDVRYDRSLATAEAQPLDIVNSTYGINRATFDDARLHQIILSLTIKIWDSETAGQRRRRGGSCYF
ncbi:MAG TPA: hypothetical protein VLN46_03100 [Gillisia sp.]|nr:hypothetical protein [Gillisia sp.]